MNHQSTPRAFSIHAWILTDDYNNTDIVEPVVSSATVCGYSQLSRLGRPYPVILTRNADSVVDGILVHPQTIDERARLEAWEEIEDSILPLSTSRLVTVVWRWSGLICICGLEMVIFPLKTLGIWMNF